MYLIRTLVLGLLMCAPVDADADAFKGSVKDESGSSIAGATITIHTPRQAAVATVVSDSSGDFAIADLAPGDYVVQVEAPGFARRRIALTVFANAPPLAIVMNVDGVLETVTVTSSPGIA